MQYDTTLSGKIGYKNWARLVSNHHCLSTYTGLSQLSQLHDLKNWVGSPWMTHIHVIDKTTTNMQQGQTISTGVLTANVKQIKHTKYVKKNNNLVENDGPVAAGWKTVQYNNFTSLKHSNKFNIFIIVPRYTYKQLFNSDYFTNCKLLYIAIN